MADVNANINVNIDSSQALANLRRLQAQITSFNESLITSNIAAAQAQKQLNQSLIQQVSAIKGFSTSIVNVESSMSRLGNSIEKNKLSLGEYFRYGVASSQTFGRVFAREHNAVMDLAVDRVKRLQTQYVALGQSQNGVTRAMAARPLQLFNADAQIGIQRQQIFNKLLHDGSTSLVNWGKNTQWAGRQLMVGFTLPITMFGTIAGQVFADLERQIVNFKRVYGDLGTTAEQSEAMVEQIKELGKEYTKYGISVSDTIGLAAKAAAAGAQNADLLAQTEQATRLSTLGQIDYQQALDATISLQSAFKISAEELGSTIDFLNAVENQTVVSLDDITIAIPKVAPVIQGLGGDVRDLAVFMAAMREGGVNAAEGANALKSGLASLINPTKNAREQLNKVGIDINTILKTNKGDLMGIVTSFADALRGVDKFAQQQTLAKVFGKYQFARMGALFENIGREGSQAARAVDIMGMSMEELAQLSEKELGNIENAISVKFTAALEKLKLAIAPIGEMFLKIATPIIDVLTKVADKFNELPEGIKTFISYGLGIGAVLVPSIIMLIGLMGNFLGNIMKIGLGFRSLMARITGNADAFQWMASTELDAMAAAASLEGATSSLTGALVVQRETVDSLAAAYARMAGAAQVTAASMPQAMRGPVAGGANPRMMARGGIVPGTGNKDTVPALLTPGESVITKEATQKFGPVLAAMNAGTVRGFTRGVIDIGGGESIDFDFVNISGQATVQKMYDQAAELGEDIRDAFVNILRSLKSAQESAAEAGTVLKITAGDVKRAVVSEQLPSRILPEGRAYKASAAGVKTKVEDDIKMLPGITTQQAQAEFQRAQAAAQGAEQAVVEYYDELLSNTELEEKERRKLERARDNTVKEARQISRAHTAQVTNLQKSFGEAWSPELWLPQSQVENQLSNIFAESQSRRDIYETHLKEIVSDTNQADAIMHKINNNLALTDEELQVQAQVLRRILSSSQDLAQMPGAFSQYAVGTIGAAQARAALPASTYYTAQTAATRESEKAAALRTLEAAEQSWKETWQISSPSERGANIGDDINEGVGEGLRRSVSVPVAAAKETAQQVKGQLAMDFEDTDALFPAEPYRGQKRFVPTERPEDAGRVADIATAHAMAMEEDTKRTQELVEANKKEEVATQELTKEKKTMSQRVRGMSGKLVAGGFALDGLVFGMSMMDNSIGEFAQKLMPAMFALQGIAMIAPMLTNPVGAVAVGLAASAAAIWFFKSKADEMSANAQKFADSMIAARSTIDKVGEFYGRQSLATRQGSDIIRKEAEVTTAEVEKAREFIKSDVGLAMQEGIGLAISKMGQEQSTKQFAANLASMVLQGVMNPKEARAAAVAMGEALGNQQFGIDVNGELKKLMGPKNKNLLKTPLQLAIEINEQNAKSVQSLSGDITQLSDQMAGFNQMTGADMAAALVPVFGMVNTINKLTLGWDNWVGQVARSARGILNPDDFEKTEASLKAIGSLAGNQMAQAYDNLSSAKARYKTISEKAAKIDKDDEAAKKRASTQAKEAKRDLEALTQQVKDQQAAMSGAFAGAAPQARVTILEGMRESITKQFENDPAMKLAWDVLSGQMGDVSQEVQFNINMGISSGVLNPLGIQKLMGLFSNPEEATATINYMINAFGLGETNEMILGILNMKDEEIRKKAIIDLIVATPGGLDQETRSLLDPTGELSKTALQGGPNQAVVDNAKRTAEAAKAAYDTALSDFQMGAPFMDAISESDFNMLQGYNDEVSRIKNTLKEFGYTEEEIAKNPEYVNALEEREGFLWDLVDRYDEVYNAAYELQGLESTMITTQKDYNKAVADNPALSGAVAAALAEQRKEIQPLVQEFYRLQDAAQAGEDGININIQPQGMGEKELNNLNNDLTTFNKLPKNILKLAGVQTVGSPEALDKLTKGYNKFDSEKPEVIKKAILQVMGGNGESADKVWRQIKQLGYSQEQFAKLPEATKINIVANIEAQLKLEGDINVLEGFMKGAGSADAAENYANKLSALKDNLASLKNMLSELQNLGGDTTPTTPTTSGSGGSKEKSALQQILEDINERIKLYGVGTALTQKLLTAKKGFGAALKSLTSEGSIADRLREMNLSETLIAEILSKGADNADKIIKKLNETGLKRLSRGQVASTALEQISGFRGETARAGYEQTAAKRLKETGQFTEQEIKDISGNEALAEVIALLPKGSKLWQEYIKYLRQNKNATKENVTEEERLREELDLMTIAFKKQIKPIDDKIDAQERLIESINREIDAIERQNSEDEYLIRNKERQIEAYNREIEAKERLNQADQDRIENLKRGDEKSMRVSEALSHELEIMSRKETEIRNAYDERIKALETIQNINEQIAQQQKQQLGLADALSRGDIAAAAVAQQEIQQSSAQFAMEQMRTGLQQGMENQIAGLTTEGGLTRDQAEQKIVNLKEESYQTSLLIRDIEDVIYERNKEIAGIKLNIRNVEDEIQVIEDRIYNRETMILDIQRQRLQPAEDQLQKLRDQRDELQRVFDAEAAGIEAQLESIKLSDAQKKRVEDIADEWRRVEERITAANEALKTGRQKLGAMPERKKGQSYDDYQQLLNEWWANKAALEANFDQTVSAAFSTAEAGMRVNTGGMIPKYAAGGVAGMGGRDSVPALLTPGEFVMRKAAVKKYGAATFAQMNMGAFSMPTYSAARMSAMSAAPSGGMTSIEAPVYNTYSVNVNVPNTNADPELIANRVMTKIQQLDRSNIRSLRGNK